ncbi:MAG: hypothetical protein MR691_14985 [Clostridium sp.]|nr:hypothetical protein [Clostridium sp.]
MKNNLSDVNNYLFEELERLNDDETLEDEGNFKKEIQRAKAVSNICSTIVANANLILNAKKYADELGINETEILKLKEK